MHSVIAGSDKPLPLDGITDKLMEMFRKDQNLFVYFEVYDPAVDAADKTSSVAATLSSRTSDRYW